MGRIVEFGTLGFTSRMTKTIFIAFGVILVAVAGLLTWIALQPPAVRPSATVIFGGYTNDAAGMRLAVFTVSNTSVSSVRRLSHYWIQIPTSKRWTNISEGWFSCGTSVLPSGGTEVVTVVVPTNQASWRPRLTMTPDVGALRDMMDSLMAAARNAGLPTRSRKMTYSASSDWISE
jgi:hypothetical protein